MDLTFLVIFILFFVALIVTLVLLREPYPKWVYCIMITGKDTDRIRLARKSVQNFIEQDYKFKKLVIINHHSESVVSNPEGAVYEFKVPKAGNTLGDLRNIALQLVPIDAIWTVWDDDDYRSPDYLSVLYSQMKRTNADVVLFTNRYEYNSNTKFVWEMQLTTGFVTVFAKQDMRIRYLQKDSMEDTQLIDDFRKLEKKIYIYENDPMMYIRLVHSNNTSKYVNKEKTSINRHVGTTYNEKDVADPTIRAKVAALM